MPSSRHRIRVRTALPLAAVAVAAALVPAHALPAAPRLPGPCAAGAPVSVQAADAVAAVQPPRLAGTQAPRGPAADALRSILLSADRHALGTQLAVAYAPRFAAYADLRGDRWGVRPPTSEALGLAVSTETGAYDARVVGQPVEVARAVAVWLTRSMACSHRASTVGGWGGGWQSPYHVAQLGMAGWLLWPHLAVVDRAYVAAMVIDEADRLLTYPVPYYADANGRILHPGDTKAEENAWDATVLSLAASMMPHHPHRDGWLHKAAELMLSSFATPADVRSRQVVNGAPLSRWLHGWNAQPDGTVVNHKLIHPDYMATIGWNAAAPVAFGLAGEPTPRAAFHNFDLVYRSLRQRRFPNPPFASPGGAPYVRRSGAIYYPQGNDWGYQRVVQFLLDDVEASALRVSSAAREASAWQRLHAARQLALQRRADDGRSFLSPRENGMPDPEQWVFEYASRAWLTAWVAVNHRFTVSDADLSATPLYVRSMPAGAPPLPDGTDLPRLPVPMDLAAPSTPTRAVPEAAGDAVRLDDEPTVTARGDIVTGSAVLGAHPAVALRLAAAPTGDVVGVLWTAYDAAGRARYVVTATSRADGALLGSVLRVADGRRICGVRGLVSGASVTLPVAASCLRATRSSTVSVLVTTGALGGGRGVVTDVLGG